MAFLVSLSLSVPLCSLQNPVKLIPPLNPTPICFLQILTARYSKKSAFCGVSGMATTNTAFDFSILGSSKKGISSVNAENYLNTMTKHFDEIVSCSLNASCTCVVLWGYWVGPDIDDGWGFVEAFICRSE